MPMPIRTFKSKVIAYKKGNKYISCSLDFDLFAEGDNIQQSLERLYDAIRGYLKVSLEDNETDEEIYRSAPKKYHNLYDIFTDLINKQRKKEEEKQKEQKLLRNETTASIFSFNSQSLRSVQ